MSTLTDPAPISRPAADGQQSARGGRLTDLVWLTWRQHRTTILASIALIAILTASLLYVAARITTIIQQCGGTACPDSTPQYTALQGPFGLLQVASYLTITVLFLPLLIGVFLGIPLLAREHEQRTLLLAWSQDITPQRWLWTKLALLAAVTAALSAAGAGASDHLAHVLSIAADKSLFDGREFQVTSMLPLTLSVVWLVIGVALGAAIRRTLPAAFAALAGYIGLFFLVQWRYPTFLTPLTAAVPVAVGRQNGVGSDRTAWSDIQEISSTPPDTSSHPAHCKQCARRPQACPTSAWPSTTSTARSNTSRAAASPNFISSSPAATSPSASSRPPPSGGLSAAPASAQAR